MADREEYNPQQTPSSTAGPRARPQTQCQVNRALLPIKGYYFFFMAAVGDLLPFVPLYMRFLGLTYHETGIIYGVMPFVGFLARPLIGAAADKYKRHKHILMLFTIVTGVSYFLLVFVPKRPGPEVVTLQSKLMCNTQDSFLQDCQPLDPQSKCPTDLTTYANTSSTRRSNMTTYSPLPPLLCSFTCKPGPGAKFSEFQACFTNDTGPYNKARCNGTLSLRKHLAFAVPGLETLVASELTRDRFVDDGQKCRDYDLKNIRFMEHFNHDAWQILCERELMLQCEVQCGDEKTLECPYEVTDFDATFFAFFFIFLFANIAFAPLFPILDAATYDNLGDQHHLWGKQRMWGTVGFALFAVAATFIMYVQRQNGETNDYYVFFYIFVPLCVMATIIANFMRMSSDVVCGQFLKNVWNLLSHFEISAFLLVIMFFGMLTGGLEAFLFWYLGSMNANPLVFGFILVVNCCAELPMLWIAGGIIQKIGHISCLYLACLCYAIRLFVYSVLTEPWLVLLVEPLHGVTFALMYAAASAYASIVAPPGLSATVQGLLGGMHFGCGKGLGSLVTGFMYESLGPRWTWRTFGIISLVIMILYAALNFLVFKSSHRPAQVLQTNGKDGGAGDNVEKPQEEVLIASMTPTNQENAVLA